MKFIKSLLLINPIILIILETLSNSTTLNFLTSDNETIIKYYSYFDINVFTNGNVFCLPCAILSIIMFLTSIYFILFKTYHSYIVNNVITTITLLVSFLALIQIVNNITWQSIIIVVLVFINLLIINFIYKYSDNK